MPADDKGNRTRSIIWSAAIVLSLLLAIIATFAWRELQLARSGKDLKATYRAFHAGLLGKLMLGGCSVGIKEPWMPSLKSYENLEVSAPEVVFYNTAIKGQSGEPPNFSVIRRPEAMSGSRYGEAEMINGIAVKFVDREFSAKKGLVAAWVEKDQIYVVSESEKVLRDGLSAVRIDCNKDS